MDLHTPAADFHTTPTICHVLWKKKKKKSNTSSLHSTLVHLVSNWHILSFTLFIFDAEYHVLL